VRPANDADTVIDVRADPTMLATFTEALSDLGFRSAGISAEDLQHRWVRGKASIDVLLPDGIGKRASRRSGVTGSPTLPTAGGTQALQRSETVRVSVAGREGFVRRPDLVGALVGKAAALSSAGDPGLGWHRRDFVFRTRPDVARSAHHGGGVVVMPEDFDVESLRRLMARQRGELARDRSTVTRRQSRGPHPYAPPAAGGRSSG
jgi:hypothetical protein